MSSHTPSGGSHVTEPRSRNCTASRAVTLPLTHPLTLPLTLALITASQACASIAPGLHFSEDAANDRATTNQPAVQPITPNLLVEQAEGRARAAAARAKDPSATTGPTQYEYRISPLDVLSVTVWEHPELTIPAGEFRAADLAGNPVLADGTIYYPHVGVIEVAGKTVGEVRQILTEKLRPVIERPQLDVRVVSFRGKRINVTGEVIQASTLALTDVPMRVQDAIAAARGLTADAWTRDVTLTRGGQAFRVDLQAFYEQGDASQNWLLQDGDTLHIPSRQQNKVFVLGEVRTPSSKVMAKGSMSLAEAIGDSSGFDPVTSNPGEIYVIRGGYNTPSIFKLDASSADALLLAVQFQLEPRDVVFVSSYALTDWNRVLQQLMPTVQGLWRTIDLTNRAASAVESMAK